MAEKDQLGNMGCNTYYLRGDRDGRVLPQKLGVASVKRFNQRLRFGKQNLGQSEMLLRLCNKGVYEFERRGLNSLKEQRGKGDEVCEYLLLILRCLALSRLPYFLLFVGLLHFDLRLLLLDS